MSTQKKDVCRLRGIEIMVNDGEIRPLCPACRQIEKIRGGNRV